MRTRASRRGSAGTTERRATSFGPTVGSCHGRATIVVLLALLLTALVTVAASIAGRFLVSEEVTLPALAGLDYEQAAERLRALDLVPLAFPEIDPRARANEVLSQSPGPQQVVRPGRRVALGVNAAAEVRVAPAMVGLRERDALLRAEAVGTVVQRVSYVHGDQPVGTVVHQEPAAGVSLAPLQTIRIVVSRGAGSSRVALPDLRGVPIDEAAATLTALGIRRVERLPASVSFDRPGAVTDQRPAGGAEVLPTTPVTLVYALEGSNVVYVPDLLGMPLWQAQLALMAAQLELGAVHRIEDPAQPSGVLGAWPQGITVVGSPVALTVNGPPQLGDADASLPGGEVPGSGEASDAEGSPALDPGAAQLETVPAPGTSTVQDDGSRVIPFRFDPAEVGVASLMREPYTLRLVVADDEGERVVFDRRLAAGEGLAVPVRVVGQDLLLQTFLNDSFFQAWRP